MSDHARRAIDGPAASAGEGPAVDSVDASAEAGARRAASCPNCGMERPEWSSPDGYSKEGLAYCCEGCAEDRGCVCFHESLSRSAPPAPRLEEASAPKVPAPGERAAPGKPRKARSPSTGRAKGTNGRAASRRKAPEPPAVVADEGGGGEAPRPQVPED